MTRLVPCSRSCWPASVGWRGAAEAVATRSSSSSRPQRLWTRLQRLCGRGRDRRQDVLRGLRRARRTDPPGGQAGCLRGGQHDAARPALTRRGSSASRRCSRPTRWCWRSPRTREITSLDDLTTPGTTIAIGDPAVPVGSYTREVLGQLPADQRKAILRQRALRGARRERHRRQADAGSGRRGLRLHHRRHTRAAAG